MFVLKALVFGLGSIGKRHIANLKNLHPDIHLIGVDPFIRSTLELTGLIDFSMSSPESAIQNHADADFALICSPDVSHLQQMAMLAENRINFCVEKPCCTPQQLGGLDDVIRTVEARGLRCAVGHQYRFHKAMPKVRAASSQKSLRFYARDALLSRYGPNVLGAMLAHPVDTALWCLGPAKTVDIASDGIRANGKITHNNGAVSYFDCDMDVISPKQNHPRVSQIKYPSGGVDLPPDDAAYVKCLSAYLDWLQTGKRDYRTATLAEGRDVVSVLWKVKAI